MAKILKKLTESKSLKCLLTALALPLYLLAFMGILNVCFFDGLDESQSDTPLGNYRYVFFGAILLVFITLTWMYEKSFQIIKKGFLFIFILLLALVALVFSLFSIFSVSHDSSISVYNLLRVILFCWLTLYLFLRPEKINFRGPLKTLGYGNSSESNIKIAKTISILLALVNVCISLALFYYK